MARTHFGVDSSNVLTKNFCEWNIESLVGGYFWRWNFFEWNFFFGVENEWKLHSNGLGLDSRVHWDSNSQSGSPLGSVWVHSLTLSYTLGSMKCDSWVSLLAHTFASPCLGRKAKARVVTDDLMLRLMRIPNQVTKVL